MRVAFDARVLFALIASPSDTLVARDAVERAIYRWNSDRARSAQVVMLPRRWETDSIPLLGGPPQEVINQQLLESADIVFGVFHSRLGLPTPDSPSGTAEEIIKGAEAGKPTHVYFADMPHPPDVDAPQLARLREFRREMETRGLLGTFVSEEDLASQIRSALEHDVLALDLGPIRSASPPKPTVRLRAHYESSREQHLDHRGRLRHRTVGQMLVVTNEGLALARDVRIALKSLEDGGEAPPFLHKQSAVDIPPGGSYKFPLLMHASTAQHCEVEFSWKDDDGEHQSRHSVSLL
jgi:hypothetical protein